MSIQTSELKIRKSAVQSDGAGNGGRMTATEIASGVSNNIFPNVYKAERLAGITRYRKVFLHISNTENLSLIAPSLYIDKFTNGDDSVTMFLGTATDTQSTITGSERQYGSGKLDADVSIGGQAITVLTEGAALGIFQTGDKVRISNMASVEALTGDDQVVTISSAVAYAGDVATFSITETLNYNFTAATTRVMSVIKPSDMSAAYTNFAVNTVGSGDFDDTTYPVITPNLSTIFQSWTLTVNAGGTTINVTGDTVGDLGDFSIGSDISPANPDFLSPYFTLTIAGKTGTYTAGDTITFDTQPNALGLWLKQVVPAGATNLSGNSFSIGIEGE